MTCGGLQETWNQIEVERTINVQTIFSSYYCYPKLPPAKTTRL